MQKKIERDAKKLPYAKPCLQCVELLSDEVLAKGCKLSSDGMSPGAVPCNSNGCNQPDS